MRSSNLRAAPRWITPDLVKRVLDLAMPAGATTMPVQTVPTRGIVPQLEIVPATFSNPPEEHARRSDEREVVPNGPAAAVSPPRPTPKPTIAAANRRKSKPNAIREVTPAAICRPADPTPSREPALPAPQQARAHPITIVQARPNAPRHINYAERMNAAIAHLRARSFVVQRHNRDEIIARWHVSGWTGLFSNEQLVALAQHHGLELQA